MVYLPLKPNLCVPPFFCQPDRRYTPSPSLSPSPPASLTPPPTASLSPISTASSVTLGRFGGSPTPSDQDKFPPAINSEQRRLPRFLPPLPYSLPPIESFDTSFPFMPRLVPAPPPSRPIYAAGKGYYDPKRPDSYGSSSVSRIVSRQYIDLTDESAVSPASSQPAPNTSEALLNSDPIEVASPYDNDGGNESTTAACISCKLDGRYCDETEPQCSTCERQGYLCAYIDRKPPRRDKRQFYSGQSLMDKHREVLARFRNRINEDAGEGNVEFMGHVPPEQSLRYIRKRQRMRRRTPRPSL